MIYFRTALKSMNQFYYMTMYEVEDDKEEKEEEEKECLCIKYSSYIVIHSM